MKGLPKCFLLIVCAVCGFVTPSFLMAKSKKARASSSVNLTIPKDKWVQGPTGPTGPVGPQGAKGDKGEQGGIDRFDPKYALVYVIISSTVDRNVSGTGEKVVPLSGLESYRGDFSLDSSTRRLSIGSGIYRVSYQMFLDPLPGSFHPKIEKIFIRLHPSSGPTSDQYTDWVHACEGHNDVHSYSGETLIEIPDDTSYEIALMFDKTDADTHVYRDPDQATLPGLGRRSLPVAMVIEKIAEYTAH